MLVAFAQVLVVFRPLCLLGLFLGGGKESLPWGECASMEMKGLVGGVCASSLSLLLLLEAEVDAMP